MSDLLTSQILDNGVIMWFGELGVQIALDRFNFSPARAEPCFTKSALTCVKSTLIYSGLN